LKHKPCKGKEAKVAGKKACSVAIVLTVLPVLSASGQELLSPSRLDPTLKRLEFGQNVSQVLEVLKNRTMERYERLIRDTMDVSRQDQLRRARDKEIAEIGKDFYTFQGSAQGWEVSVIRDEFATDGSESMLHIQEGKNHLYFFFAQGVLYKFVIATVDQPMSEWLSRLEAQYGEPTKTKYIDDQKELGVESAYWEGGLLTLELLDKTKLFQSVCVKWALKEVESARKRLREKSASQETTAQKSILEEATKPTPSGTVVEPLDDMLGIKPLPPPEVPPAKKPKPSKKKP
jgi:hypothetical protein